MPAFFYFLNLLLFFFAFFIAMAGAFAAAGGTVAVAGFGIVLAGPAECAKVLFGKPNGTYQIVDALESQGGKAKVLADVFHHVLVFLVVRVGVLVQIGIFAFTLANVAAGNEVVNALGSGEVDELAGEHQWRACNAHVGFFTAHGVELLGLLAQLGAADNGIVAEHQAAVLNKAWNRNQLHGSHMFALALVLGHKGAGPGGSVLYKGTCKLDARFVGVTQGVGGAGVGNAAGGVGFGGGAFCKGTSAAVAGHFYIAAFVAGGRVTIVHPKEGAYSLFLARFDQGGVAFGGDFSNFAGAKIANVVVAQVG